jgi:hypothetical protein
MKAKWTLDEKESHTSDDGLRIEIAIEKLIKAPLLGSLHPPHISVPL